MKKTLYALFFSCLTAASVSAQGFDIGPLSTYTVLRHWHPTSSPQVVIDSIDLPFLDDFSYKGPFPDSRLWADRQVFVNRTMAGFPPSVGVATFDAIDETGTPYGRFPEQGPADTLTSNFINLRHFTGVDGIRRPLSPADSVYLSFFLQPKGRCYAPLVNDTLVLEFRDNAGNWLPVATYKGINAVGLDSIPPFTYYVVPIRDSRFFYGKFQFRFRNFARQNGAYEFWHLDYVKIAPNRRLNDRNLADLAFSELPPSVLKRYTSMPWRHARAAIDAEFRDSFQTSYINHFATTRNPLNTNLRVVASDGTVAVGATTLLDGVNIPPNLFFQSAKRYPSSWKLALGTIPAREKLTIQSDYSLTIDGQEGKDTLKLALNNDMVQQTAIFDNYFAYDDGTAEMQFTATGSNMQVALAFQTNVVDTLRGVQFFFPHVNGDAPADATFRIKIWRDSLNTTPVYQKIVKPLYLDTKADTLQGFTTYRLDTLNQQTLGYDPIGIPLVAGRRFFIGWQNVGDVKIPIGLDRNNLASSQQLSQYLNGRFQNITQSFGAVMVRALVGGATPVSSDRLSTEGVNMAAYLSVYPNPAQEALYVDVKQGLPENYRFTLINAAGQVLKHDILRGGLLSLEGVNNGFYILIIRDVTNNRVFHHKFAVSR